MPVAAFVLAVLFSRIGQYSGLHTGPNRFPESTLGDKFSTGPAMSYFQRHIFFCLNERKDGRPCCADRGAQGMQEHAKKRVRELGLSGPGGVRVNKSGCLDRCELGPVAVVYPDAVWYTYIDASDIDEIVESHLRDGKPVERLRLE